MIPETIAHYRILRKLGSGGMGEVYLAEDTNLERTVAVKILPADLASDEQRLRRFIQEAKAASALKHPNVAGIYELGQTGGMHYIVMEHIEGDTLDKRFGAQPASPAEIVNVAIQVADALDEAHAKGIIHRDIKPANIMITPRGQIKVLDFGLAKLEKQSITQDSRIATQTGTEPGIVMGTVQYMSPEQALGKSLDQRSDIFSFGVAMYQMATGRLPFAGATPSETIQNIVNKLPEAIARFNYNVPPDLEHVIRRCLEKDPERRYQSARDLLIDLKNVKRDIESGSTSSQTVVSSTRRPFSIPALAILALLIAAAAFISFLYFRRDSTSVPNASTPVESRQRSMIAILPFENLGTADDQYFAAGMTEEITSRLAAVKDLGVISRTSAMQYDRSNKTMKQIGSDLGVDYVLEGTVRWHSSGETNRVRVTPQLIRVADDTHLWSEIYDRVIDDVFQVQSDIAQNVIASLNVTLVQGEKQALTAAPTSNVAAYQAYLRAVDFHRRPGYEESSYREALKNYEEAVSLDPNFAVAHAALARVHLELFHEGFDPPQQRLPLAKQAIDKALSINPELPQGYVSLGFYHYYGFKDYERALQAFSRAQASRPNDSDVIESIGYVQRRQGKFEESIASLRRAMELNPLDAILPQNIGVILTRLRRYQEAEEYYDLSLRLYPDQAYGYGLKAMNVLLWKGSTEEAKGILQAMPSTLDSTDVQVLIDTFERNFEEVIRQLEASKVEVQREEHFFIPRSLLLASAHKLAGHPQEARRFYEQARSLLEREVQQRPEDPAIRGALAETYAGLGLKEQAIREAEAGVRMYPVSRDAFIGSVYEVNLLNVYAMTGETDKAFDLAESLLQQPAWFSIHTLRLDPSYDALRNHPRYHKLLSKYLH